MTRTPKMMLYLEDDFVVMDYHSWLRFSILAMKYMNDASNEAYSLSRGRAGKQWEDEYDSYKDVVNTVKHERYKAIES
jgi:hypothetical protein